MDVNEIAISVSKYLEVPIDECRNMPSPPCSPLPPDWHLLEENPPSPWVEDFDLDATEGVVHLGDGLVVDLSTQVTREFSVTRRGAIVSRKSARNEKVKRLCSEGEAPPLPPIIVDCYE